MRRLIALGILALVCRQALGGGPEFVAGASFFDPTVMGTPVTWAQGAVTYYTDQGDLSGVLPGASADAFVAAAFGYWTSVPTAALAIVHGGQLAEDVNGSNVTVVNGVVTLPADIQPSATATPVGIVYDEDGSVTEALLGSGASNSAFCDSNSVFGGIDNFSPEAQLLHALVVLNGNCATASAQLPDLQYHLVRIIGRVLGLAWSQANLNVITGNPSPIADDYRGFPVMHEIDPPGCVPIATCFSSGGTVDPAQPKMDDQAALSRLYPVTLQNSGPQRQVFSQTTARIHGSIFFSDPLGNSGQPMQGVNVVARWIAPVTGLPSREYVASSISGFLFGGNAGNQITGFIDAAGQNFNQFGSSDATMEGFYDLAGLQIPNGSKTGQYQLTIEPVDPLWSENAGPYGSTSQVKPSGAAQPITVSVSLGGDTQQDVLMQGGATRTQEWYAPTSYGAPAQVPLSGDWAGGLSTYGVTDYFEFSAQTNRTLSIIVSATDELGDPTNSKTLPVIGMWAFADPGVTPAPAFTPAPFNTPLLAESRMDAQILQSGVFRLGIADYRGDGRPDYLYHARVFYGDNISPARASVAGGTPLTIQGLGLQSDTVVQAANVATPALASSATKLLVQTPAVADGVYDVQLADSATGGNSDMSGVLTVGAGPNDEIRMVVGVNPATPVGGEAPSPFTVMAVAPDGVTPVAGATVQFSSSPPVAFSACGGASICSVLTDQSGLASTRTTVLSANAMTLTASLAPASYSTPQEVQTTLLGVESALDLSLLTPPIWIAQGATVTVPVTVRVLSNGNPQTASTVNFQLLEGGGALSASSAQTDSTGLASVTLQLSSATQSSRVVVCVAPNNSPCQTFSATLVPTAALQLQPVSGNLQVNPPAGNFEPVIVRVTDSANPPHSVAGASVLFQAVVGRAPQNAPIIWTGEAEISQSTAPVILAEPEATVISDANGLASFALTTGGASGAVAIIGSANVGNGSLQFAAEQLGP